MRADSPPVWRKFVFLVSRFAFPPQPQRLAAGRYEYCVGEPKDPEKVSSRGLKYEGADTQHE
jgi:hypothetical protein